MKNRVAVTPTIFLVGTMGVSLLIHLFFLFGFSLSLPKLPKLHRFDLKAYSPAARLQPGRILQPSFTGTGVQENLVLPRKWQSGVNDKAEHSPRALSLDSAAAFVQKGSKEAELEEPALVDSGHEEAVDEPSLMDVGTAMEYSARYLHNPLPYYPERSRELGEEGRPEIKVWVGIDGRPRQVALYRSSGFVRLDEAAVTAVKQWHFEPAKRGEHVIDSWLIIPIPFRIVK